MRYVDGFLLIVPKKNLKAYAALARRAGKVWMEHGALEYRECAGEDLATPCGIAFPQRAGAKRGDVVVFSWITYNSKEDRDRINKAIMDDPMMKEMGEHMPFDGKRMFMGGFKPIIEA